MDEVDIVEESELNKMYQNTESSNYLNAKNVVSKAYNKIKTNTDLTLKKLVEISPALSEIVKNLNPKIEYQLDIPIEILKKIKDGTYKFSSKRGGEIFGQIRDVSSGNIVSNVDVKKIKISPDFTRTLNTLSTELQIKEIMEQLESVNKGIEYIRRGQQNDRVALYNTGLQLCMQLFVFKKENLKLLMYTNALTTLETARNMIMLEAKDNINDIINSVEEKKKKDKLSVSSTLKPKDIEYKTAVIRSSLEAINNSTILSAYLYSQLDESEAGGICVNYYKDFIKDSLIDNRGLEMLHQFDGYENGLEDNYWLKYDKLINEKLDLVINNKQSTLSIKFISEKVIN